MPADEQQKQHRHQLELVQRFALVFGTDECGDEVVARFTAAALDQVVEVVHQLVPAFARSFGHFRVIDRADCHRNLLGGFTEEVAPVRIDAEKLGDDGDRQRIGEQRHRIHAAVRLGRIEEVVDDLLNARD